MRGLSDISFENEAKIRHAVVSISIATLVLANLELASDRLTLFGLEFVVSLEKIVAVFRLSLVILLLAMILIWAEQAPRLIVRFMRSRDNKWWSKWLPEIENFHASMQPRTDEDDYHEFRRENPEWDDELYAEKYQRQQKRVQILGYFRPIALFGRTTRRHIFPLILALVALLFPKAVLVLG